VQLYLYGTSGAVAEPKKVDIAAVVVVAAD
jgi:hypothetical protein